MPGYKQIKQKANMYRFPDIDDKHRAKAGTLITNGDGHGCALRPLFVAIKHGMAPNLTKDKYQQIVQIYKHSFPPHGLSKDDLLTFKELLNGINFKSEGAILWLGDMLADRGGNDYLTLLVFQRLHQCGINFKILLSNHDVEFIHNYEHNLDFMTARRLSNETQYNSMKQLGKLLAQDLITREEINTLMKDVYLPVLKLISYTVNEAGTAITIFSHAPIGLTTLEHLTTQFQTIYSDSSLQNLTETIDAINQKFTEQYVKTNTVSSLIRTLKNSREDPVSYTIWNRETQALFRPEILNGIEMNFSHGHHSDEDERLPKNIINLDNTFAKAAINFKNEVTHYNKGEYTALYAKEHASLKATHWYRSTSDSAAAHAPPATTRHHAVQQAQAQPKPATLATSPTVAPLTPTRRHHPVKPPLPRHKSATLAAPPTAASVPRTTTHRSTLFTPATPTTISEKAQPKPSTKDFNPK
ncbi:MAG: hypothetical protein A3F46_07805 [Legionellales bacterium RIFCSPHIGHO2_12_FULL_42_9]|nr:MAG: hypothetical protein A3F46_07805 [Legionellales bacterium RIFCSPHIGHO2_12_FULL_42_9]